MENMTAVETTPNRARRVAQTAAPKYAKRLHAIANGIEYVNGLIAEAKRRSALDGRSYLAHYAEIMDAN